MPDMLVPLLKLPALEPELAKVAALGVTVRRANPWEITPVLDFVRRGFSQGWADETSVAFAAKPVTAFVATLDKDVIGFAAYECTRRDYFGPTGVAPAHRNKGIGRALLQRTVEWARASGVSKLELHVFAYNTPAIALYESFGFVQEGYRRRHYRRDGEYLDAILMAFATDAE